MSWYNLSSGAAPTGSEAASFASNFLQIPDNTTANAKIKSFLPKEFEGQKSFGIVWEILDGEYAKAQVKQSITPYADKPFVADRAKEMFVRLYNLCDLKPKHANEPTKEDLTAFNGKVCSIKIGNGIIQGVERTWVREVHSANHLPIETGHTAVTIGLPIDSALSRNQRQSKVDNELGDDVPF